MKKLFYLLACFCGFSLQAVQKTVTPKNNKLSIELVENSIDKMSSMTFDYKNCFCPIPMQNLLACQICRGEGYLTPVLDANCPTPDLKPFALSLRIITSFDDFDAINMSCPTPPIKP